MAAMLGFKLCPVSDLKISLDVYIYIYIYIYSLICATFLFKLAVEHFMLKFMLKNSENGSLTF